MCQNMINLKKEVTLLIILRIYLVSSLIIYISKKNGIRKRHKWMLKNIEHIDI